MTYTIILLGFFVIISLSKYKIMERLPSPSSRKRKSKDTVWTETVLGVLAVVFVMISTILVFAIVHAAGKGGEILFTGLLSTLGVFAYFTPILSLAIAYYLWKEELPNISFIKLLGLLFVIVGVSGFGTIVFDKSFGGSLGVYIDKLIVPYFSIYPSAIVLFGIASIGGIIILERKPSFRPLFLLISYPINFIRKNILGLREKKVSEIEEDLTNVKEIVEEGVQNIEEEIDEDVSGIHGEIFGELSHEEEPKKKIESKAPVILTPEFTPPPLELLNVDSGKSGAGDSKSKMVTIQRTLEHFKIHVEMGEVTVGPSVTQFTLKPAQGVNLSKIVSLHDNLAMELGSEFLRIEAPIPGKTLVGIEIPNERKAVLGLRSMLELDEFKNSGPLSLAIGKSIIGKPVFGDLEKMPHLLVAGATRTGKSVTLQNLLVSLLYKNSPYDLKLIILDPKRVEFTSYTNLPHLYTPIIKEPKTAIKALNWAIQEMERRYEVLAEHGQVNVTDYNKKILSPALEKARKKGKVGDQVTGLPPRMPYIIIVFDEYNDFMLSYPKEITPLITALSQKGRAAGIHLILATQRPDVKVITGTIKANIPSRIALKTTSQIDSRTILDSSGAEDLLGNGDMLYMASDNPRLVRLQAPFISMEEIKSVVSYIKEANDDFVPDQIDVSKVKVGTSSGQVNPEEGGEEPTDDEDYMSAKDYVVSTGKASTSSLQTAFRWGYNKAARIINDLERYGVIGPARQGERYREILGQTQETITQDDLGGGELQKDRTTDDIFRT